MKLNFSSTKPNNPLIGDVYYDILSNGVFCYDGSNWIRYEVYNSLISKRIYKIKSLIQSRITS
jgi:hypothetical protein